MGVEFGLLGPLRAVRDGTPLPLGGPRQRAVLARLLLDPARVVPVGVLIDDVWGGDPPETATKTLQKYVSELRKILGPNVVLTSGHGYSVDVEAGSVDARRFEGLLAAGDFDGALALWRGEALADLPDVLFVVAERSRLQELRLVAVERRLEAELTSGRHVETVPVLTDLTERWPVREQLCGLLMLALYRSGRLCTSTGGPASSSAPSAIGAAPRRRTRTSLSSARRVATTHAALRTSSRRSGCVTS